MCSDYILTSGRQLKLEGDNFRQKLNAQNIFEEWVGRVQSKNISLAGRIFNIEKRQKDGKISLKLKVNFSPDVVTLFKEVSLNQMLLIKASLPSPTVFLYFSHFSFS